MQVEVRAVETFADLLFAVDSDDAPGVFYNRLCQAACTLADMQRAAVFLYDSTLRRVRVVGSYGIGIEQFRGVQLQLESAPIALRALREDRVLEATERFEELLPAEYVHLLDETRLVVTPISAAGRWPGVLITDRPVDRPLTEQERHLLWSFGKIAALAASARLATREIERARQLQERIDLARELHDGVVQRLFGVSMALSGDELSTEQRHRCADEIHEALTDLRETVQRTLGRASRDTSTTLLEEVRLLAEQHPEMRVDLDHGPEQVPPQLESLSQSVLREALRNALRHADPQHIDVRVRLDDGTFVLEVCNDGVPEVVTGRAGVGLRLAAVEALQHGGVVEFGRKAPGAWQVRLIVPVEDDR